MTFLPPFQLFDQLKELVIDDEKVRDNPQYLPDFIGSLWAENNTDGRLGTALQHVLSFFIEACRDRVVLLENYKQGWQRRAVIVTLLQKIAGLSQRKTGKLLDLSQPLDPRTVSPMPIGREKTAGSKDPPPVVVLQRLTDALGQHLLDLRKLILVLVAFLSVLGILLHSFLVLQRVVMVVDPQSLRFLLQRVDRGPILR